MNTTIWTHQPCRMEWVCGTSFHIPLSGSMNASASLNYDYVSWYECSSIAHVHSPSRCLQFDLATSNGLHIPHDLIPSSLPRGVRNTPSTVLENGPESIADLDRNSVLVCFLMIVKSTLSLLGLAKAPVFVVVEGYSSHSKRFEC